MSKLIYLILYFHLSPEFIWLIFNLNWLIHFFECMLGVSFPPHWRCFERCVPVFYASGWRTLAEQIQSGALPCRSTGQAATPPWPPKTPWRPVPSRKRRSWRTSWRRRRRRGRTRSASPSREATAPPTHTTIPTPAHRRHPALSPGASPVPGHLLLFFLPSRPSSPRFPTVLCGGDPICWRPLHIVRAYYIYPNLFSLSVCCL